jgi:AcrR family transcriptional regulator
MGHNERWLGSAPVSTPSTGPVGSDEPSDQRAALLAAASRVLAADGPTGLTVRRIAHEAGTSTMGVYSHFGGKAGVLDALFGDGFATLLTRVRRIRHTTDPTADLLRCAQAYRTFALEHPARYEVMFGRAVLEAPLSAVSEASADAMLAELEARIQRCLDAGAVDPSHGAALGVAHGFWATCHGLISLELAGLGTDDRPRDRYGATLDALAAGLAQRLG